MEEEYKVKFKDEFDLVYHLFLEMDLDTDENDYVYDRETLSKLAFNGKMIKASGVPKPLYAGRDDIIFDIYNYNMMKMLFGYIINKASQDPDVNLQYIADFTEDEPRRKIFKEDRLKQRMGIRTANKGDIYSDYYNNICLAYVDLIFKIYDNINADLSNFDIMQTK